MLKTVFMFENGATPATSETFPFRVGSSATSRARVAPVETPTSATFPSSASDLVDILWATWVVSLTVRGVILSSVRPGRSGTTTRYPARAKPSARFRTAGSLLPSGTVPLTRNIAGHGPSPAGLTTSEGFPATRACEERGPPPAASTAGVRTGTSRTEEITTTARTCASTHDQYEIDSPIATAS